MFSPKLALAAVLSAALVAAPVAAQSNQQPAPPPESRTAVQNESQGDLLIILAAIVGAGLLAFLATQIGGNDDPASP
jgi:FlaG/FlaF family flagellin (archaellin)